MPTQFPAGLDSVAGIIPSSSVSERNIADAVVAIETYLLANPIPEDSGASVVLESAWVQITNAQMLDLADTPVVIVDAPAVGKYYLALKFALYMDITGAYTCTPAGGYGLALVSGTEEQPLTEQRISTYQIHSVTGVWAPFSSVDPDVTSIEQGYGQLAVPNEAIALTLHGGEDFGGGDAANLVYCKVWYMAVSLP